LLWSGRFWTGDDECTGFIASPPALLIVRIFPLYVLTVEKLALIFARIVKESAGMDHAHGHFQAVRPLATLEGTFANDELVNAGGV
jgi:hypothetical protein